ncbi:MAG: hypothetical protein HZA93_15830 [Verrucomicrobia bacterium]|nr:hypothetical protein [Verrucomicrobiota bacterium]
MKAFAFLLALFASFTLAHANETGVRLRFGLTDQSNTKWDGTVSVSPGRVDSISGWRFQQSDKVEGITGWKAETRPLTVRRTNAQKQKQKAGGGKKKGKAAAAAEGPIADNGVILHLVDVTEDSEVSVTTPQGRFSFKLSEIPYGKVAEKLGGAVDLERTAATRTLTKARTDDDYPAVAVAPDGTTYVAHISFTPGIDRDERVRQWTKAPADFAFLATPPGGDQLWLRVVKNGRPGEPIAVTPGKGDIYKVALAVDGRGVAWIVWSENAAWQNPAAPANFEIWARSFSAGTLSAPVNLSNHAGSDTNAVAATDASGRVWIAWQGARDGAFRILSRHQTASGWSETERVSTQTRTCWTPAIATAADGRVAIAWDTYEKGDYDVWLREFDAAGKAGPAQPVTSSPQYEARPALTYDRQNRLWVCWELSGPTWGKDWGALVRDEGIGLYRDRQIGMRILEAGKWLAPDAAVATGLPGARMRRGPAALPVRRPEAEAIARTAGEEADEAGAGIYNNLGRIVCDRDGRIWLLARSREGNFHTPQGTVWMNYATYFDGAKWTGPILLPHSDNLLYNLPAVATHPAGGLVIAHSSDHRQGRHVQQFRAGSDTDRDPFDNDVFLSRLEFPATAKVAATLKPARATPNAAAKATPTTERERRDIAAARAYRFAHEGKSLRIVRGEFHRHTEISGDGGNDGPLEDMWRYAIDVAGMDWLGNGDHDNGQGREYTWWLTQKTTDAFRIPGVFEPPFTYERSVRFPEGHRNAVFEQRGVRTLPRLPISERSPEVHAPDTLMFFDYLKQLNGVCASHTSATSMGTDWRDWGGAVEPMVEIYQGARQNYERPGAPRSPTAADAIGGWEPTGFVNLAFKRGYRFSFQSSSDHGSTHISYALVLAEDNSRAALLKAMRQRHTYAATDNIIAEYTCTTGGRTYLMGDEFTSATPPTVRVKFAGTAPFKKVTLVKDDVEIVLGEPNKTEVDYTWTDPNPVAGKTSYYYVRGEQSAGEGETVGELVWASPMWIKYEPKR